MEMPNDLEAIHLYPESRLKDIKLNVESMPPLPVMWLTKPSRTLEVFLKYKVQVKPKSF